VTRPDWLTTPAVLVHSFDGGGDLDGVYVFAADPAAFLACVAKEEGGESWAESM